MTTLALSGILPDDLLPIIREDAGPTFATIDDLGRYIVGNVINAYSYGVKADGMVVYDAKITTGTNVVESTGYAFIASDVGKLLTIRGAGNADGSRSLSGYIGSVVNGNALLVTTAGGSTALNAARTVTNAMTSFGTDNVVAVNDACIAANARYLRNGIPAVVQLPNGMMVVSDSIEVLSGVSFVGHGGSQTMFKYIRAGAMGSAMFTGLAATAANPYMDNQFRDFGCDLMDSYIDGYFVSKKHFYIQQMVRPVFSGLLLIGSHATSMGVDFLVDGLIENNTIMFSARSNTASVGGSGGAAIGIGTTPNLITIAPGIQRPESVTVRGNIIFAPTKWGIFFESQSSSQRSVGLFIVEGNIIQMTEASWGVGISDSGNVGMIIANNRVIGAGVGTGIACLRGINASSPASINGKIIDNIISGTMIGIDIAFDEELFPVVANYDARNNKVYGCVSHGIRVRTSNTVANAINGINLAGNESYQNGGAGIALIGNAPIKRLNLQGVSVFNNGTNAASAIRSGVYFGINVDRVRLEGANIYDDQATKTQSFDIEVAAGKAVTNVVMPANDNIATVGGSGTITGVKLQSANYP